jgi:hypothetical protein
MNKVYSKPNIESDTIKVAEEFIIRNGRYWFSVHRGPLDRCIFLETYGELLKDIIERYLK